MMLQMCHHHITTSLRQLIFRFKLFSVSAEGLAVGIGIGTIAEVVKQSLGGKQKGGMLMQFSLLLPYCLLQNGFSCPLDLNCCMWDCLLH